jgi:cytochrome P450
MSKRFTEIPALSGGRTVRSIGRTMPDRLEFMRTLTTEGDLVRTQMLSIPIVFVNSAQAAHDVLVANAKSFEKSPGFRVLLYYLGGNGLFTAEGELWRKQRKLMAPIFQPAPIAQYAATMQAVASRAADRWTDGERVDLSHECTRIAMSVVGKALFDADTFDEADALGDALAHCLRWVNASLGSAAIPAHILLLDLADAALRRTSGAWRERVAAVKERLWEPFLFPGARGKQLHAAVKVLDERIQGMIDERRRQGLSRNDLLTRLLAARDAEEGIGTMSDRQVRDEAVTLFIAGHETTATALAWCFAMLARHPEWAARAQAEADAYDVESLARDGARYDARKLDVCERVFKEVLRMYPPLLMLPRRTLEPVTISGYEIPAKTLTFTSPFVVHHRPDTYESPERFDPDRWLPERESARHKGSYLPFGLGPRYCIGMPFALMEGPIVLAQLLRRWRFDVDTSRAPMPDDYATLRPMGGVQAVVRRRDGGAKIVHTAAS